MSLRYDVLNLELLDTLREICVKSSKDWTDDEAKRVSMILMAIQIVASQRKLK